MHWRRKWQPTPVFLPGESQGRGSLVGCHLWGLKELNTTERLNWTELIRNVRWEEEEKKTTLPSFMNSINIWVKTHVKLQEYVVPTHRKKRGVNRWFKHPIRRATVGVREGNGTPLQYSCLENPMDRGVWCTAVHGVTELDMIERLHFHFWLSCIGEGSGNTLHCSCLENPRDRVAWWAAIYRVAQSWTWLKQLSSSSNTGVPQYIRQL